MNGLKNICRWVNRWVNIVQPVNIPIATNTARWMDLVLAGDALGFLDPVFSSGVFLALKSGAMLADEVDVALSKGSVTAQSFDTYGKKCRHRSRRCAKLSTPFTIQNLVLEIWLSVGSTLRGALTDCLIGNVDDQDFKELFDSMSDLARLPEPLEHGLAKASG
jgi:flavin-dependent dehydrogenase